MFRTKTGFVVQFIALALVGFVALAGSNVFAASNPSAITIRDYNSNDPYEGRADPYPAVVTVSGIAEPVTRVTVTLTDLSHDFPGDIDILLVGPGGQSVILMSDASDGGGAALQNVSLTFDDLAGQALPFNGVIQSGTYRPTNHAATACSSDPDRFPAPAPAEPYGATLSVFNGVDPNGDWKLYVVDDCSSDGGSIAGGWSVNINPPLPPTLTPTATATATATPTPTAVSGRKPTNTPRPTRTPEPTRTPRR
jgi:subtilisin-like proprotein convertase family protein